MVWDDRVMKDAACSTAIGRRPRHLIKSVTWRRLTLDIESSLTPTDLRKKVIMSPITGGSSSKDSCNLPEALQTAWATASVRVVMRIRPCLPCRGKFSRIKSRVVMSTLSRTRSQRSRRFHRHVLAPPSAHAFYTKNGDFWPAINPRNVNQLKWNKVFYNSWAWGKRLF